MKKKQLNIFSFRKNKKNATTISKKYTQNKTHVKQLKMFC